MAETDESALLLCRRAAELIFRGQYEDAREALGSIWQGVGNRPPMEGLSPLAAAEVLLRCGVLSGWIGSGQHTGGAQDAAKALIVEALGAFESLDQASKVSEARYELGICYWRLGALDEARVTLDEALRGIPEGSSELRAKILIRRTLVEISAGRYHEAWSMLEEEASTFNAATDAAKGRWHGQRALVLRRMATAEGRADYSDRAIIEFTAAIYHYDLANHTRHCGSNLNNLAMLLYRLGRYEETHEYIDRARAIFVNQKDTFVVAQVDDTRARISIAEGRYEEALDVIEGAVRALEDCVDQALLADAMAVQGVALARLGEHGRSVETLKSAIDLAERAGVPENAGHAALTLLEEHGGHLSVAEVYDTYLRADRLLSHSRDMEAIARLRNAARRALLGSRHDREMSRPLTVFLCHSSKDKAPVRDLYRRLLKEKVDAWLDEEKLSPGDEWEPEIIKAIRSSDVVIVCLSNSSVSKVGFVQKEIRHALNVAEEQPEGTAFLIPLRFEACTVPDRLTRWQRVDLYDDHGFQLLLRALRKRAKALGLITPC